MTGQEACRPCAGSVTATVQSLGKHRRRGEQLGRNVEITELSDALGICNSGFLGEHYKSNSQPSVFYNFLS